LAGLKTMTVAQSVPTFGALMIASLALLPQVNAQESGAAKIYAEASKSVLLIYVKSTDDKIVAQGTGFLVANGKLITNKHVIRDGVPFIDLGGVRLPASVESTDDLNDIAILTIAAEISAEPLVFAENPPPPGSTVFAIGNPRGLEKSISTGVLSAVRNDGRRELLQITTPISPGSSGGPVFNSSGKVIGVAVGSLEDGQNLNFAVPASAVIRLLRGQSASPGDVASLIEIAQSLLDKRKTLKYSAETTSPFQENEMEISSAFATAIQDSSKPDIAVLIRIVGQLADSIYSVDRNVALLAAERVAVLAPSPTANLALAKACNWKAVFSSEIDQKDLLSRSEKLVRRAIGESKSPSTEMYYLLGDTLLMRRTYQEAEAALRRSLELNRTNTDAEQQSLIFRDLVSVAEALKRPNEIDKWFSALVETGKASAWDWTQQAQRLDAAQRYAEAGESWQKSAEFNYAWTDWCEASGSFELAPGKEDATLFTARKCIELGVGQQKSEARLSAAHASVARVLNDRGVYEEALSHSKEAAVLDSGNATAYDQQAVALLGLHRNQESINAAKQAIRLSDGKYGIMHFHLGYAYFETENWTFARQSYEKAAALMPSSDSSAYNVALCLQRLNLYLDAAHWYEEALRRNPNRNDKQDILKLIQALRQ
jgi:tetratricopeptide (TPR) repeat protein